MLQLLGRRRLPPPPLSQPSQPTKQQLRRWSPSVSSLKVAWRKDRPLDFAIQRDKPWRLCARVVREVLNEPGRCIPLRYLEKRRERLHLAVRIPTFLSRYPNLFDLYADRIKPASSPVPFVRPSDRLRAFLADEVAVRARHEGHALAKLCKLLMMSRNRAINAEKLFNAKREFGLPDDFLVSLVPKHPGVVRLVGDPNPRPDGSGGRSFVELVSWDDELARSVIERRAEEESAATGVRMRPNFNVKLPPGFYLRREMRQWTRDWLELPYVSPYTDASVLQPASPEMEKRSVGLLHELLSLTLLKRMAVPVIGKFCKEFRLSNAFWTAFTRHPGIFYLSLKGGVKTAVLREAYDRGVLVDKDPLLEIKDKFEEMMSEGHRTYIERMKNKQEAMQRDLEMMAKKNSEMPEDQSADEMP